ncbi:MAG: UDP-N-acetylmuramoyl-tripeptide--D-alanyl-D-alanine ligase [Planctomycetota bacterium]|nr:UDP-N-acetylmuramoyl-tripeptide--D-alanyl-D-alanine ligase [Planctomycetota bacterium]
MTFYSPENLKSILGGTWLARADAGPPRIGEGLSTDSRSIKPGQVFLALRGERTDGHAYLEQIALKHAALAIVDRPDCLKKPDGTALDMRETAVLLVNDTGQALLRLAAAWRQSLEGTKVIAIGGSNGKTTTTRLVESVLSRTLRGTASQKSFNNAVGVPLTILNAKRGDQFLICEVGTNAPGEIAILADVVKPDIAVITSVGREHLEGLGSLRGVAVEEASLCAALEPGGTAIINADAPFLTEAVRALASPAKPGGKPRFNIVRFGVADDAELRVTDVELSPEGAAFRINGRDAFRVPLPGRHNAMNAAAAAAVGRRMGIANEHVELGLAIARGPEMRLERVEVGGVRIINDAYNANPDSMLASLDTFESLSRGATRRWVVLGDMLELGEAGPDLHREIGDAVLTSGADHAVLIGPLMMFAAERVSKRWPPERITLLPDATTENSRAIAALFRPGDAVLLKGSRGMGLERVLAALRERFAAGGTPMAQVSSVVAEPKPRPTLSH